ncbi:MAG: hypothetical protein Q4F95_03525 [Oscillospiraceae bacterium]|nr:hypothetical protein [Oscillospiraceae bacterium]
MLIDRKIFFLVAIVSLALTGCVTDQNIISSTAGESLIQQTQNSHTEAQTTQEDEDKTIGSYTDEELFSAASELYSAACRMGERYISGHAYSVDKSITADIDSKKAYKVNDFMVSGAADIPNQWNEVFSEKYLSVYKDMFSAYSQKDNTVWAVQNATVKNPLYKDTQISRLVNRNDDEIEFTASSTYSDADGGPDKTIDVPFSIIYNDEKFTVGKFVMPY